MKYGYRITAEAVWRYMPQDLPAPKHLQKQNKYTQNGSANENNLYY